MSLPRPAPPTMAPPGRSVSFDRMADRYDETRGGTRRGDLMGAAVALHVRGERVLEVGVGTGLVADALRRAGHAVVGVDLSLPMLRHAHARLGDVVAQADGYHLPLASATVDSVALVWVMHLVPDRATFVAEAARVLRPGGRLVVVSSRHEVDHDDITHLSFGLGDRVRPAFSDGPDELVAAAGPTLRYVGRDHTPYDTWQISPNDEADRVEARISSSLWDLDDERWARDVAPAVAALRRLPEPDRPRQHRSRHELAVFERR